MRVFPTVGCTLTCQWMPALASGEASGFDTFAHGLAYPYSRDIYESSRTLFIQRSPLALHNVTFGISELRGRAPIWSHLQKHLIHQGSGLSS